MPDVVSEAKFSKHIIEEASPLAIVRVIELEEDEDVGADVDCLDSGGRRDQDRHQSQTKQRRKQRMPCGGGSRGNRRRGGRRTGEWIDQGGSVSHRYHEDN